MEHYNTQITQSSKWAALYVFGNGNTLPKLGRARKAKQAVVGTWIEDWKGFSFFSILEMVKTLSVAKIMSKVTRS